ncbi:hypothetical protein [Vibrio campbellii]
MKLGDTDVSTTHVMVPPQGSGLLSCASVNTR